MNYRLTFGLIMTVIGATADAGSVADQRLARFEAQYQQSGEFVDCLSIGQIRETRVIDGRHILFRVTGGYYLTRLPNKCPRLGITRAFGYRTSTSRLCNVDVITAIDHFDRHLGYPMGAAGPRCGLGKFEKLEKIEQPEHS